MNLFNLSYNEEEYATDFHCFYTIFRDITTNILTVAHHKRYNEYF